MRWGCVSEGVNNDFAAVDAEGQEYSEFLCTRSLQRINQTGLKGKRPQCSQDGDDLPATPGSSISEIPPSPMQALTPRAGGLSSLLSAGLASGLREPCHVTLDPFCISKNHQYGSSMCQFLIFLSPSSTRTRDLSY